MTFRPPLYMQDNTLFSYSAADDRFLIDTLFNEGIVNVAAGQALAVQRPDGANMQVYVPPFDAIIDGDDAALQGAYLVRMTAAEYATVTAAPATNSRIDLLVCEVNDGAYRTTSTTNPAGPRLRVIAGTAAASPVVPAVPATAIPIAQITVAAAQTSIVTANITDRRTQSGAATIQIGTTAVPLTTTQRLALSNPISGYLVLDTTLGKLFTYGGPAFGWVAGLLDIQTFTTSGTWTKPNGAGLVFVDIIGAGGGGSGGIQSYGGAGGGGGSRRRYFQPASTIAATVSVTVGAAGAGGGVSVAGVTGGQSAFGLATAGGGLGASPVSGNSTAGGLGGSTGGLTAATTAAAAGGLGANYDGYAEDGGGGGASFRSTSSQSGGSSVNGGGGGGMGAGLNGGGGQLAAGAGGGSGSAIPGSGTSYGGGASGGTTGTAGSPAPSGLPGTQSPVSTVGGGGGGGAAGAYSGTNSPAGTGGAGGTPGGGGGGGGAVNGSAGSTTSAGGPGARGEVRVYTFCI